MASVAETPVGTVAQASCPKWLLASSARGWTRMPGLVGGTKNVNLKMGKGREKNID